MNRPSIRIFSITLILTVFVLAACNAPAAEPEAPASPTEPPATTTPSPPTATPEPPFFGPGPFEVNVETDGVTLAGTLNGEGDVLLILAPMYPGGPEEWSAFVEVASDNGYRTLTYDFRGMGASDGTYDLSAAPADLEAMLTFASEHELAEQVVLMGPGEGGLAVLHTALTNNGISGAVLLSPPRERENLSISDDALSGLTIPTLWIAARQDLTHDVEAMSEAAGGVTDLWIYEGSGLHGTYIFEGFDRADLLDRLLAFAGGVTGS